MILLGLLVVALVCIVIGVVTAAGPWFVASLVTSAVAGFLLWHRRNRVGEKSAPAGETDAGQVWVVDGRPRYHASGCAIIAGQPAEQVSLAQAQQDGFIPCSLCAPSAAVR